MKLMMWKINNSIDINALKKSIKYKPKENKSEIRNLKHVKVKFIIENNGSSAYTMYWKPLVK